ncbi:TatD family hydrolase [Ferruginibacter albus]|uniref:TatD family hydrolase n=1 Tax=Ferruginibacter albus TaxID=2875540 RepID=UPI001CC68814|nr:TatD family hydrolase [Ferruginibacter albus]UAY52752.1 TatD family hydrolase [Ferruginibacter albus]
MLIVDTHCHLYSEEFEKDINAVIERAESEGVNKFFLPAIDSNSLEQMLLLEEKFPGKCFAMMGLHPCYVKENYKEELAIVEQWLGKRKFAAVGEIGLDFYWDKTFTQQQYEAFHTQIAWAKQYGLPIVIHTRNAMRETIDLVKAYSWDVSGIFHCFGGNYEEAKEIIELGFYLGIGGIVTYKNSPLIDTLQKIDLKHIVLETDAPYLSPVPFRGKRNESSYLKYIIEKIADIKQVSKTEVAETTTANAKKIFSID